MQQTIADLAKQFAQHSWDWNYATLCLDLQVMGWHEFASVGSRTTFKLPARLEASIYRRGESVDFFEITFQCVYVTELSKDEYEAQSAGFMQQFNTYVAAVADVCGHPSFVGSCESEQFPEDQEALWLAAWELPTTTMYLQFKHEDRELPFRLCVVMTPRAN